MSKAYSLLVVALVSFGALSAAAQPPIEHEDGATPLVTAGSRWRCHYTFIPPRISQQSLIAHDLDPGSEAERRNLGVHTQERFGLVLQHINTPPPPEGWIYPDFDDSEWLATSGGDFVPWARLEPDADNFRTMLAADNFIEQIGFIAKRGKFIIEAPDAVEGINLSLSYRGGFVAYLNGREIARANMPEGGLNPDTPAEDYPVSAFEEEADVNQRIRQFGPVEIDPALLREGVNVLAVQLHRSDYPVECRRWNLRFATIGLKSLSLSATTASDNVATSLAPPEGLSVWTEHLWQEVTTGEFANPTEELRPVRIEGARNGLFSGMVMVGSTEAIAGLSAKASPLAHEAGGADIPADRINIRYGARPVDVSRADYWPRWDTGVILRRFDALLTEPPDAIAPVEHEPMEEWGEIIRDHYGLPPVKTPYASVPVVMTISIPSDAAPGRYSGELTILAAQAKAISVPVELRVSRWSVPDRKDYQSVNFLPQSYGGIADSYGVEHWSEEHWNLIERSLERIAEIGNAGFIFSAIQARHSRSSIVRTVRREDGKLEHDFSRMERYLDLALQYHAPERIKLTVLRAYWHNYDRPWGIPHILVTDEATGESETIETPEFGSPEFEEFLAPILHGMRDVLAERGLEDTIMIGQTWDPNPEPKHVAMYRRIMPDTPWYRKSHFDVYALPYDEYDPDKTVPVGSSSVVPRGDGTVLHQRGRRRERIPFWQSEPDDYIRLHWNRQASAYFMNFDNRVPEPWRYRGFVENAVLRGYNGIGHSRADIFYGQGVDEIPEIIRGSAVAPNILAPGHDGPVHSLRSLNMLEGVQETEARIAVWRALTDEDNPPPDVLAEEIEALLEERTQAMRTWDTNVDGSLWSGTLRRWREYGAISWLDKNRRLFDFAAEAEQADGNEDAR